MGLDKKVQKYYVKTTAGNSLLRGNDEVTVQLSAHSYVRKRVQDLHSGELILFDVQETRTTLEDVEPHLPKSPLYSKALDIIYAENNTGERIPRLRVELLQALGEKSILQSDDLDAKIMREGESLFSGAEYKQGAKYLSSLLQESNHPLRTEMHIVAESTLESWLRGQHVKPRDDRIFELLSYELGGRFASFMGDKEDPDSFYRNHAIWKTMRQQVMRKLNSWRNIKGPTENDIESESTINIGLEVGVILGHLLRDVTPEAKGVLVTKVEALGKKKSYGIEHRDRLLGLGIITKTLNFLKPKSYQIVSEEWNVLLGYGKRILISSPPFKPHPFTVAEVCGELIWQKLVDEFKEKRDPYNQAVIKRLSNERSREKAILYDDLTEQMKSGILGRNLDRDFSWPAGTLIRLYESIFRLQKTLPIDLLDCYGRNLLSGSTFREQQKDLSRLGYNLYSGQFLSEYYSQSIKANMGHISRKVGDLSEKDRMLAGFASNYLIAGDSNTTPAERLLIHMEGRNKLAPPNFLGKKQFIYTREYVGNILADYDLLPIIDIRSRDFVLEDSGISFPKPPKELLAAYS